MEQLTEEEFRSLTLQQKQEYLKKRIQSLSDEEASEVMKKIEELIRKDC